MEKLSEIVNKELEEKDEIEIKCENKGQFYLKMVEDKTSQGNYHFECRFRGDTNEEDALIYMADFLRGLQHGKVYASDLEVTLKNYQRMHLRRTKIINTPFCIYELDFYHPLERKDGFSFNKVLTDICKGIHGFELISEYKENEPVFGPFGSFDESSFGFESPEKGIIVNVTRGLDSGTVQEERANELISKLINIGMLSEEEIKILREYDWKLVDKAPKIENYHGLVFHKDINVMSSDYLKFLDNLHPEIKLVEMTLCFGSEDNPDMVTLKNTKGHSLVPVTEDLYPDTLDSAEDHMMKNTLIPEISFSAYSVGEARKEELLDHIWEKYHLVSGDSIELVKEALGDPD